jgi:2-oxoglutarate dehydrogenase E2 component (dihydrolipoamide succinyltransferase)
MTSIELKVPAAGESVTEGEIAAWLRPEGAAVQLDEPLVVLETAKATLEVGAPAAGRLTKILHPKGDTVHVGETLALIEVAEVSIAQPQAQPSVPSPNLPPTSPAAPTQNEPARPAVAAESTTVPPAASAAAAKPVAPVAAPAPVPPPSPSPALAAVASGPSAVPLAGPDEEIQPMSVLRRKIAENLVRARSEAALLTTFNEIDMNSVLELRKTLQAEFQERHQVKLGLMSFFVKAVVDALQEFPVLNAEIRGTHIVYRHYQDIGVAIGSGRGLVVPVLRRAERLSFADIEKAIADFSQRARDNTLKPDELAGGTFTITNGGIYGSLLSTPIVNPPQSGVLGMHAIQDRPIACQGQVVIRPMMYVALTYDHRLVDGREAVSFLKRIKLAIETPARLLLEV